MEHVDAVDLDLDLALPGAVVLMCRQTGELHRMAYGGFEQDRETPGYRCPARYLGSPAKAWIGAR
ncbi:MAG: hypothetical protein OXH96_01470 [Spirochaetaceae bacterium]|nr:hypothetical protein [Spirochaetaceae bacterium]